VKTPLIQTTRKLRFRQPRVSAAVKEEPEEKKDSELRLRTKMPDNLKLEKDHLTESKNQLREEPVPVQPLCEQCDKSTRRNDLTSQAFKLSKLHLFKRTNNNKLTQDVQTKITVTCPFNFLFFSY
jgi:hypothetical protein